MPPRKSQLAGDELREALLDAAGDLLHREGVHALSTRRLAQAVGTSTQAIYTLYGGKEGVLRAMYREGFERLAQRMQAVAATADPLADLHRLGLAYRASALASPNLYDVMFGTPVAEFACTDEDRAFALSTFVMLASAVDRAIDAGMLGGRDAATIALHCWVASHGFVSLELGGYFANPADELDAIYDTVLFTATALFETEPGSMARRAKLLV